MTGQPGAAVKLPVSLTRSDKIREASVITCCIHKNVRVFFLCHIFLPLVSQNSSGSKIFLQLCLRIEIPENVSKKMMDKYREWRKRTKIKCGFSLVELQHFKF